MPDGGSKMWTPHLLVKMPLHWLVQDTLNPSCGRSQFATIHLQLQIFSSARGFEAIQLWWLLCSSWRGEAESWALHWYAQFTYCLCVHLLIWRRAAARLFCGGNTGRLTRIAMIWRYHAASQNLKRFNNSEGWRRHVTSCSVYSLGTEQKWCLRAGVTAGTSVRMRL